MGDVRYSEWSWPFIESWAARHGYWICTITDPPEDRRHPTWQKLVAHRYAEARPLLVMDLDICPMPWAGDIVPHVSRDRISLTRSGQSSRARRRMVQSGIPLDWHFNDSYIGIPSGWERVADEVYESPDAETLPYAEMAGLNRWLANHRVEPAIIPSQFDHQISRSAMLSPESWMETRLFDCAHFAGPDRHKTEWIKRVFEIYGGDL